jgi:hypothetical protein
MEGRLVSDPLEELEKTAKLLPAAVAGVKLGDRAKQMLERFRDVSRQEHRLKASIELANLLEGSKDSQLKTQVEKALEAVDEAAEAMKEVDDEQSLADAVSEYQAFILALSTLEVVVRPLWKRTIDQQFAPLNSVGALLESFPNACDLGKRMVGAAASAQKHALTSLLELPAIVKDLIAQRSDLLKEQQEVAGDPKVSTFLQALADDRATLDLLHGEVLEWLDEQGALSSLKVSPV